MIFILIKTIFKFFIKEEYPRWYGGFLEVLSTLLMLATFWFTSKAYAPANLDQQGYFAYLLIGELCLHLPFSILFQGIRLMKRLGLSGVVDQLLVAQNSLFRLVFCFLSIYFVKGIIRLFLLILSAGLFFELPFPIAMTPKFFFLQVIVFFPIFFLSFSVGSIVLFWGRGENIWGQISSWLSFLSGAYFPILIFPVWIQSLLPVINPFALYLEICRRLLRQDGLSLFTYEWIGIFCWFFFFILATVVTFRFGLSAYRKRGPPNSYSF